MLALRLDPKPSRRFVLILSGLQAAFLWVLLTKWQGWWQGMAVLAWFLVTGWTLYRWRKSAAYCLDIRPDGSAVLTWQNNPPKRVVRTEGTLVSLYLLVATWQDEEGLRYQTVLWPDSVTKQEFKMAYVWLRWQPLPNEEKKQ